MTATLSRPLPRRLPSLLACFVLSALLACLSRAQPAHAAARATITLLSPTANQTVGDAVTVRVRVAGVGLDASQLGAPALADVGHWHLYVDGVYAGLSVTATLVVPNPTFPHFTAGQHLLTVVLHTNDHHPLANASVPVRVVHAVDFLPEPLAAAEVATPAEADLAAAPRTSTVPSQLGTALNRAGAQLAAAASAQRRAAAALVVAAAPQPAAAEPGTGAADASTSTPATQDVPPVQTLLSAGTGGRIGGRSQAQRSHLLGLAGLVAAAIGLVALRCSRASGVRSAHTPERDSGSGAATWCASGGGIASGASSAVARDASLRPAAAQPALAVATAAVAPLAVVRSGRLVADPVLACRAGASGPRPPPTDPGHRHDREPGQGRPQQGCGQAAGVAEHGAAEQAAAPRRGPREPAALSPGHAEVPMVDEHQHTPHHAAASGVTATAERTVRLSEGLWSRLEAILLRYDPPPRAGRRRTEQRRVLEAVLYRIATNCAWQDLPASYPHPSSVYRSYRRWRSTGALGAVLNALQEHIAHRREVQRASG